MSEVQSEFQAEGTSFADALPVHGAGATLRARPLCVDLDGTLVKSDTLVDALLLMVRTHTVDLVRIPSWILQGKATLKREVTHRVQLDVAHLPYNQPLLHFLEQQRGLGRSLYLATGADAVLAERVAHTSASSTAYLPVMASPT